jgi:hypothetical protein
MRQAIEQAAASWHYGRAGKKKMIDLDFAFLGDAKNHLL